MSDLSGLEREIKFKVVKPQIYVIQPGISLSKISESQSVVLGAAAAYLKQTLNIEMSVIGSE